MVRGTSPEEAPAAHADGHADKNNAETSIANIRSLTMAVIFLALRRYRHWTRGLIFQAGPQ